MKFGLTLLTQRSLEGDAIEYLTEIDDQATLAERLGFDSLWVTEHHFLAEEMYFDNVQLLSYLARATEDITLGSAVWLLPLHNPVKTAERAANLDVLSNGRFTFGVGAGYRQKEFDIFNIDRSTRATKMEESLRLLRRLWTEDHISFDGDEYSYSDISIHPKPIQQPSPEIWVGGDSKLALRHAVNYGNAWIPAPSISFSKLQRAYDFYDGYCDDMGTRPNSRPLMREVYLSDSTENAMATARGPLMHKYDRYSSWDNENATGAEEFEEFAADRFIIGDTDRVIESIEAYQDAFDTDHLVMRMQWPSMDDAAARDSIERFAEEVMPSFI